ncbi:MAG: SpoIIE family protein phosphatase [Lachnospiraceae bacterium]|nr:SpoIIE family protein phosphatase [Lachnospiraceae bacterium]
MDANFEEKKKSNKLSKRITKFIVTIMVLIVMVILIGSSIASFILTTRVYKEKTMQVAEILAKKFNGADMMERIHDIVVTDEYQEIRSRAEAEDNDQLIRAYFVKQGDALMELVFVDLFNSLNKEVEALQQDMDVKFLYISIIEDGYSYDIFDPDEQYFAIGRKTELSKYFKDVKGNERIEPRTSWSEYGWLSTGGVPITDSEGKAVAVAFCDISMNKVLTDSLMFSLAVASVATGALVLTSLILKKMVQRRITAPIELLTDANDRFAKKNSGRYTKEDIIQLDINTGDEIEELYHATRFMQSSLIDYMDNLTRMTAEKERLGAELNVATQIQADMLPRIFPPFPERTDLDIYAYMTPAKEVGGDFYDFFLIDEKHLGLVMADVSGKGVPAALFMVIAKTLIKNRALNGELSPAVILSNVNDQLCEGNEAELFVTVWLAIIDLKTGKGKVANAGHEHPAIRRADGKYELSIYKHSMALATMEGLSFKEHEFQLYPGDSVFVYTDGVSEATDANNELFGTDRMLEALNIDPDASQEQILKNVKKSVDEFVGKADKFDDLTMLGFKYYGSKKNKGVITMSEKAKELDVDATDDMLETVINFVNDELEKAGADMKSTTQIDIAVEELFVNIAHYAYNPETGPAKVRVEVDDDPLAVSITFFDNGIPYDPLAKPDPDVTLDVSERQIGGLGIFMVKKSMDNVEYEYKDGQNILKITKKL